MSATPAPPRVLVVDDDRHLLELLTLRLEHHGYAAEGAGSARDALARLAHGPFAAAILDLRLPDADGLDLLASVRVRAPDVPVIMLTAHGTIETAVEAMRRGAYGFLTKPFHDHELLQKLTQAVENGALRREVAGLRRIVGERDQGHLLGTSAAIARVRELIARVAPTEATVLVTGESGTGKELAARSLHALSPRRARPLVALSCAAIPAELMESELFGHVGGAYPGAPRDREGLFVAARGSTLFLDEVGDASPAVQSRLVRVLQERRYSRVGSSVEEAADVRIVAATHRDLRADVLAGRFREDLFFRIHVVPLEMPPLRERPEDVTLLAEVFLERASARHGLAVPRLHPSALAALLAHRWPGNVRELGNVMEAALLLADARELRAEHLASVIGPLAPLRAPPAPAAPDEQPPSPAAVSEAVAALGDPARPLPPLRDARDAFERAYLVEVLRRASGNVSAAARAAGRNRTDFYDLLRRHGLSPAEFK